MFSRRLSLASVSVLIFAAFALALMACAAQKDAAPPAQNETITNNQEEGVDEGDIVKNIGDSLVILRKGRLYAVDVGEVGALRQTAAVRVAASEALNDDVWYDEMLVRGRHIYVIGYRYGARLDDGWLEWTSTRTGATEIDHFVLALDGTFERRETMYLESNDYYDTSNYASRMIEDRLVFYIPFSTWRRDRKIPHMLKPTGNGRFERTAPLFRAEDVQSFGSSGAMHTIVSCDVEGESLVSGCSASVLESGWARQRYVTADDVYLWTEDRVIAFSLRDGSISAHAARGYPRDQFSFHFDGEVLHVLVQVYGKEATRLEVLSLPRVAFDERGGQMIDAHPVREEPDSWVATNRFVDGQLLIGMVEYQRTGSRAEDHRAHLHVFDLDTHAQRTVALPAAGISRIEPLSGIGALVSAYGGGGMTLYLVGIEGEEVAMLDALELEQSQEGEHRSHGFFFKPAADGGGDFGLPLFARHDRSGWWGSGVSNIAFFGVSPEGQLALHGAVSSSGDRGVCATSCIDWYGNTRPIFLRDRVIAFMGSEMAEVALDKEEGVRVLQRLSLR